jgi:catechol 2,3-dioxygenase-like lactoylglutathione lyase family enzyme
MLGNARVYATVPVQDLSRARRFYENTLGLKFQREMPGGVIYECGSGTLIALYERPPAIVESTVASFEVDNLDNIMSQLRDKGVSFEDYNLPYLKTENGIATVEGQRVAWFKDPDGNALAIGEMSRRTGGLSTNR